MGSHSGRLALVDSAARTGRLSGSGRLLQYAEVGSQSEWSVLTVVGSQWLAWRLTMAKQAETWHRHAVGLLTVTLIGALAAPHVGSCIAGDARQTHAVQPTCVSARSVLSKEEMQAPVSHAVCVL